MLNTLAGLASAGGMSFTPPTTGDETTVLQRIQFLATDINGTGDSTAANDGFFRVYTAKTNQQAWLRADWPTNMASGNKADSLLNCGVWHYVKGFADKKFFPAAVEQTSWFRALDSAGLVANGATTASAHNQVYAESTWAVGEGRRVPIQWAAAGSRSCRKPTRSAFRAAIPISSRSRRNKKVTNPYDTPIAGFTAATADIGGDDTTFTASDPIWGVDPIQHDAECCRIRQACGRQLPLSAVPRLQHQHQGHDLLQRDGCRERRGGRTGDRCIRRTPSS